MRWMIWIFEEEIMATVQTPSLEQSVVLHNIDWRAYCRIGRALADRPALRLTYDRWTLEIMTTSPRHEHFKHFLGRLIVAWTEERGLPLAGLGSMTFKRRKYLRGLEPDQCYWIAHEAQVRNKDHIDFRIDPPPDMVVQIDISRSSLDRMAIYGVMGVPEVWRYRRQKVAFLVRQADGRYAETPQSVALPPLASTDLLPFLAMRGTADENAIIRHFRSWIGQEFPFGGATPPAP
jgi:Uma2 family endonuclease